MTATALRRRPPRPMNERLSSPSPHIEVGQRLLSNPAKDGVVSQHRRDNRQHRDASSFSAGCRLPYHTACCGASRDITRAVPRCLASTVSNRGSKIWTSSTSFLDTLAASMHCREWTLRRTMTIVPLRSDSCELSLQDLQPADDVAVGRAQEGCSPPARTISTSTSTRTSQTSRRHRSS